LPNDEDIGAKIQRLIAFSAKIQSHDAFYDDNNKDVNNEDENASTTKKPKFSQSQCSPPWQQQSDVTSTIFDAYPSSQSCYNNNALPSGEGKGKNEACGGESAATPVFTSDTPTTTVDCEGEDPPSHHAPSHHAALSSKARVVTAGDPQHGDSIIGYQPGYAGSELLQEPSCAKDDGSGDTVKSSLTTNNLPATKKPGSSSCDQQESCQAKDCGCCSMNDGKDGACSCSSSAHKALPLPTMQWSLKHVDRPPEGSAVPDRNCLLQLLLEVSCA
jgi:hypothetical protein